MFFNSLRLKLSLFIACTRYIFLSILLCNCSQNHRDHVLGQSLADDAPFQCALQKSQRDPKIINALRVQTDSQSMPLLTAAMMCGDDATIKSLLNQGGDISAADQEGQGILHALVSNHRLSDQEKAALVDDCFRRVHCADNIRTNQTYLPRRGSLDRSRETPWLAALYRGEQQTALRIVKHMSVKAAQRDGLYHALKKKPYSSYWQYHHFDVGDENLIQILLAKEANVSSFAKVKPALVRDGIPEDVIRHICDYAAERIDINSRKLYMDAPDWRYSLHPWEYAWVARGDVELAVLIIQSIPSGGTTIPPEEIANRANVAFNEYSSINAPDITEIAIEWRRIKAALIAIGVDASLLHD